MGLFSNYNKVGPGVSKNPEDKLPVFRFIDLYFSHLSKLILLNFIFLLVIVPFAMLMIAEYYLGAESNAYIVLFHIMFILMGVFVGPAICGFTKLCRNMSCERPVFLWHDYWRAFKSNFKQGAAMGVIDMVFIDAMSVAFPLYYGYSTTQSFFYLPFAVCLICSVIFLMMHFYIYLLIVSTNLSLWKILKDSFFLTSIEIKISFINLIVTAALVIITAIFFPITAFMIVIVPSFLGFLYSFNCFPMIRKYVIQPWYDQRGEKNPELSYKETDGEALFTDSPEMETQPKESKTAKRKTKK